jgi:tRNA threonylcarbamoyladenosine biosynthesis protein TsaB
MITRILALDTAMDNCSAALQIGNIITARDELAPQKQSELILPMIESLLSENNLKLNELNAVSFGSGPGSFTGARLAASITQGLCFAHHLTAIPISTLRALAEGVYRKYHDTHVLIAIDAHLHEIYWAAYAIDNAGIMQPVLQDLLCPPENLSFVPDIINNTWSIVGDAWETYAEILKEQCRISGIKFTNNTYPKQHSHAYDIVQLASYDYKKLGFLTSNKNALPNYLQNNIYKRSN